MSTAVQVENLGKCYRIGEGIVRRRAHLPTLREVLMQSLAAPLRRLRDPGAAGKVEDFWALRKVSLKVLPGEVVGVIGRNGAGKSTLLKILARITDPTCGDAWIRGRVGSLLEVGTGFHPELTGRENVYLTGSILGMRRAEIRDKFEEIVEFSGVSRFLDTPVKKYSSGMQLRLAFAVAAHLEPEILLIDEVLAVGDANFQKKCIGKMDGVARDGKTVFFVSHNLGAVSSLCSRCIHIQDGNIIDDGPPREVIARYLSEADYEGTIDLRNWNDDRVFHGPMRMTRAGIEDAQGNIKTKFSYREPVTIRFGIESPASSDCIVEAMLRDASGQLILHPHNTDDETSLRIKTGANEVTMTLNENVLNDGTYYLSIKLLDGVSTLHDQVNDCLSLTIDSRAEGQVRSQGAVRVPTVWSVSQLLGKS